MGDHTKGLYTWTNERHMNYLSSMEASFVRSMFEINDRRTLPLDRQIPDSSESTLDLKRNHKIRRHSSSDIPDRRKKIDKKTRRKSYEKSSPSQDQVAPQLDIGTNICDTSLLPAKNEER